MYFVNKNKYLVKNEKVVNNKLGVFLNVYNTVMAHETFFDSLQQGKKDTIQYGIFASNLYLLFVLLKEKNYLQSIEKTLESAFAPSSAEVQFEIIEKECKNLEEKDKVVTLSAFRNAIAHGGFNIEEYGDQFYKFTNSDHYNKKKLVFKMPFANIQYLICQSVSYIEDELVKRGVVVLLPNEERKNKLNC